MRIEVGTAGFQQSQCFVCPDTGLVSAEMGQGAAKNAVWGESFQETIETRKNSRGS